jgi:hypothetical protein
MSTHHDVEPAAGSVVPQTPDRTASRGTRPWMWAIGAAVLAGAAGAAAFSGLLGTSAPSGPVTAPVPVPDKVGGLAAAPADQDFAQADGWQAKAKAAVGDATVVGKQYGSTKERKTIRVVAARSDLTGKLELAWAADKGKKYGDARCTQNFEFADGGRVGIRPTMLMCWRTSETFSAYSIIIDFDKAPKPAEAVDAIADIWGKA